MSPEERSLRAKLAAHSLHAHADSRDLTKAAREAFRSQFEREVDPDGTLDPAERARRAEHARKAHYYRMALASAKARRAKKVGAA